MSARDLRRARARGDLPRAPAFTGAGVVLGGLSGAVLAASVAPWGAVTRAFAGAESVGAAGAFAASPLAAVVSTALSVGAGAGLGALFGLALANLLLGAWAPRGRARWRAPRATATVGLTLAAGLTLPVLPWALRAAEGDPGRVLLYAAPLAVLLASLLALPLLLATRALARRAWRERIEPRRSPRRDPDRVAPEVAGAIADRRRDHST